MHCWHTPQPTWQMLERRGLSHCGSAGFVGHAGFSSWSSLQQAAPESVVAEGAVNGGAVVSALPAPSVDCCNSSGISGFVVGSVVAGFLVDVLVLSGFFGCTRYPPPQAQQALSAARYSLPVGPRCSVA